MDNDLVTLISELKKAEAIELTEQRLKSGEDPLKILEDGKKAMQIVGTRFSEGIYFIPDLVYSGKILEQIAELLKPGLAQAPQTRKLGTIVLGTVAGDLHDIGKNLVTFMLDVNGFTVYDLGIDVKPQMFVDKIRAHGFPLYEGGESAAPYDLVGDWFRGTAGVMVDMYEHPEKLLAVMEKLVPVAIRMGLDLARDSNHPIIGFMLHKGADGFMSPQQFDTFYWPPLKKVMMGLIDEGFVPMLLCEGTYTSRLETIADIPRGKCIYWFENVDWARAKDILGDTVCIRGGVPASILFSGTTQQIKDCIKERIDIVGRGGGYIVDCGLWFDEARHENVKTMVEFTREYGVY